MVLVGGARNPKWICGAIVLESIYHYRISTKGWFWPLGNGRVWLGERWGWEKTWTNIRFSHIIYILLYLSMLYLVHHQVHEKCLSPNIHLMVVHTRQLVAIVPLIIVSFASPSPRKPSSSSQLFVSKYISHCCISCISRLHLYSFLYIITLCSIPETCLFQGGQLTITVPAHGYCLVPWKWTSSRGSKNTGIIYNNVYNEHDRDKT